MSNPEKTKCPWNLDSYFGRWMYYSWITNPALNFVSTATIENAKQIRIFYMYVQIYINYNFKKNL